MLKEGIGFFLMCIGAMGGDSEKLWLPILIMTIGALLIISGKDEQ